MAAVFFVGCSAKPPRVLESMPPVVVATLEDAGIRDVRHLYRAAVCGQLPPGSPPCDELLLRFPGEADAAAAAAPKDLRSRYRIAFVPGFLSDCFNGLFYPSVDVVEDLKASGFEVQNFPIGGRASSAENAQRLAKQLDELGPDPRPLIMAVYSKGLPDALEMLRLYPRHSENIAAIISIAGVANGTPVADDLADFYRDWIAGLPLPGCERGSGAELHDLRRDVRLDWWRRNRSAITVPVFSLVAVPKAERVSPLLRHTYAKLAEIDPRNDSQILWYDAVVARGYLLGYVNADHVAIAVAASRQVPALSFLFHDDVPRTALVRGAIETVAATLDGTVGDKKAAYRDGLVTQQPD